MWNHVNESLETRRADWRSKLLSKDGRTFLAKEFCPTYLYTNCPVFSKNGKDLEKQRFYHGSGFGEWEKAIIAFGRDYNRKKMC